MDLRRDRKRSLKLREMEEAQEEDRKGKEKSRRKDRLRRKGDKTKQSKQLSVSQQELQYNAHNTPHVHAAKYT